MEEPGHSPGQFIDLPTELLLSILHNLHSVDLITVAAVCRQLHRLSLHLFFARYHVNPLSKDIVLQSKDNSLKSLPGLAISLSVIGLSLTSLSCDLTTRFDSPGAMVVEIRDFTRFVSKISAVEEVSLQMMHPPYSAWEDEVLDLLNILLLRKCVTLHIKNYQSSSWAVSDVKTRSIRWPMTFLSRGFFAKPQPPSCLKAFHIQALPRFLQPLLVQTLNKSPITNLGFKYIFDSAEWATFVGDLELSNLTHLSISHCAVLTPALPKFFTRHPSIISLEFDHNMLSNIRSSPIQCEKGILPHLQSLKSYPDYIVHTFPPISTFPNLNRVILPAGDKNHGFSSIDSALRFLVECSNDMTLTLEFAYATGLREWLNVDPQSVVGMERLECSLRCVKTLNVSHLLRRCFSDEILEVFPKWLSLFPRLRHVSFMRRCFSEFVELDEHHIFVEAVGDVCPQLETFSLQSNKEIWRHVYSRRIQVDTGESVDSNLRVMV